MNYLRIYEALIERGKSRQKIKGDGLEKHRIYPGYNGGKYIKNNVSYLTRREHILIHVIRYKMYGNIKDLHGAYTMGWKKLSKTNEKILLEFWKNRGKLLGQKYGKIIGTLHGAKGAQTQIDKKIGIYNPQYIKENKTENSRKGGKTQGLMNIQNKLGIFALSKEQNIENAKISGRITGQYAWAYHIQTKEETRIPMHQIEDYLQKNPEWFRGRSISKPFGMWAKKG